MNLFLISEYVKRLKTEDITKFALSKGVTLTEYETNVIYEYIKNYYKTFIYGNPKGYLEEIKQKVEPLTYNKIITLYQEYKEKFNKF